MTRLSFEETQYLELHPDNPTRPPQWRWLASGLRLAGRPLPVRPDGWVRLAVRFRRELERAEESRYGHAVLAQRFGPVFWAWQLAEEVPGYRRYKGIVEAYILAGASDEEIAERWGLDPKGIGAYAALFFDVRPRLKHRLYILETVIRRPELLPGRRGRGEEVDEATVLKIWAYAGGQRVLDLFLLPQDVEARPAYFDEASRVVRAALDRHWSVITATISSIAVQDPERAALLADVYQKLRTMAEQGEDEDLERFGLESSMRIVSDRFRKSLQLVDPRVARKRQEAYELRADEAVALRLDPDRIAALEEVDVEFRRGERE